MQNDFPGHDPQLDLNEVDRLLDSAIASYSAEEPRPGLTHRVVANAASVASSEGWLANFLYAATSRVFTSVQLSHVLRLRRGFSPAYSIGYAIVLIACVSTFWNFESARHHGLGKAAQTSYTNAAAPGAFKNPAPAPAGRVQETSVGAASGGRSLMHGKNATGSVSPILLISSQPYAKSGPDVFPTPAPLTAEERALVALATKVPEEVQKSLAESALKLDQPIDVAAIHVEPLSPLTSANQGSGPPNATP